MENHLSFAVLLSFHRNELKGEELKRVKAILEVSPHYQEMLKGMEALEEELGDKKKVEGYLQESRNTLINKLFPISLFFLFAHSPFLN